MCIIAPLHTLHLRTSFFTFCTRLMYAQCAAFRPVLRSHFLVLLRRSYSLFHPVLSMSFLHFFISFLAVAIPCLSIYISLLSYLSIHCCTIYQTSKAFLPTCTRIYMPICNQCDTMLQEPNAGIARESPNSTACYSERRP